jgi:hypothetical protein
MRRAGGRLVRARADARDAGSLQVRERVQQRLGALSRARGCWRASRTRRRSGRAVRRPAAGRGTGNGLPGAGQRAPRAEMQHSRLTMNRSASAAAATTPAANGGRRENAIRSATARPSIVSPANATRTTGMSVIASTRSVERHDPRWPNRDADVQRSPQRVARWHLPARSTRWQRPLNAAPRPACRIRREAATGRRSGPKCPNSTISRLSGRCRSPWWLLHKPLAPRRGPLSGE